MIYKTPKVPQMNQNIGTYLVAMVDGMGAKAYAPEIAHAAKKRDVLTILKLNCKDYLF